MADSVSVEMVESGLFAWIGQQKSLTRMQIRRAVQEANAQTWQEWMAAPDGSSYGMPLRFSARGFTELGLTPRSRKYQERQRKMFGKALPFFSPSRGKQHMRDLVFVRGSGWAVRHKLFAGQVQSVIKIAGARAINFWGGKKSGYGEEFMRLSPRDSAFLRNRSLRLAVRNLVRLIDEAPAKRRSL